MKTSFRFCQAILHLGFVVMMGSICASEMDDAANDIQAGRYSEALAKLTPAVEAGDQRAMYNLGVMYRDGLGNHKRPRES